MLSINERNQDFISGRSFLTTRQSDIVKVRSFVKLTAKSMGFNKTDQTLIASAVSEICRNVLDYAKKGSVIIKSVYLRSKQGILIKIIDSGPGISDLRKAMEDGFSTHKKKGMGLPGTRRMMDLFGIESAPDSGTKVLMCKLVTSQPEKKNPGSI